MTTPTPDTEAFRDQVSTVDAQGKRVWLFPKKPSGKWFNRRKWVSYSLLAFLFSKYLRASTCNVHSLLGLLVDLIFQLLRLRHQIA